MSECTCDGRERRSGSTPARDASDIPLYNGSGVRLFSLSDPREMTRTLAPYLRSHGWPADSGGTPYTLDNFIVSAIEQVPDC